MDMSCSEPAKDCLHELSTVVAQNQFEVSPSEDGALSVIFGGERLCRIVDGEVRYFPDDVKSHKKQDACDRVSGIAQSVEEVLDASLDISAADEATLKDIQRQIGYTLPELSQMQGDPTESIGPQMKME